MLFNAKNSLLMAFIVFTSTACISTGDQQAPVVHTDDLRELDIHNYNMRLKAAPASSNIMSTIPYLIRFSDEQHIEIDVRYQGGEIPKFAEVTILRNGLMDDSIDSIKYVFTMEKDAQTWTVNKAEQGFLCRRDEKPSYQASFCN